MMKQKITDLLGAAVLLGCIPWYFAMLHRLQLSAWIGVGLLWVCGFRIVLFRSIPLRERRRYDLRLLNWRLLGRDTWIQPYTQTAVIGLFFIGNLMAAFR